MLDLLEGRRHRGASRAEPEERLSVMSPSRWGDAVERIEARQQVETPAEQAIPSTASFWI
jgi:hypothetical protein